MFDYFLSRARRSKRRGDDDPDQIRSAGDCANHYNAYAGDWLRLESTQNAQDQAKAPELSITGKTDLTTVCRASDRAFPA